MIWNSAAEFFMMGGYALYVWSSFGMCALIFIGELWAVRSRRKVVVQRLQRQIHAEKLDKEENH